jgi:hypothetical protein
MEIPPSERGRWPLLKEIKNSELKWRVILFWSRQLSAPVSQEQRNFVAVLHALSEVASRSPTLVCL